MALFTAQVVAKYRDERLQSVSASAVIRELACISSLINIARKEWGISMTNPVQSVRKPPSPKGRERMASDAEMARLLAVLEPVGKRSIWMRPLVLLALETAMRRSELLALKWDDIDSVERTATLWETKNGQIRVVPLSTQAIKVLSEMPKSIDGLVFPTKGCAVSKAWDVALERAQISVMRKMRVTGCCFDLCFQADVATLACYLGGLRQSRVARDSSQSVTHQSIGRPKGWMAVA